VDKRRKQAGFSCTGLSDGAVSARNAEPWITTQDSEKTEQEESSENDAFRNSFSSSAYSLSSGGT
jgi:hypothetical protein